MDIRTTTCVIIRKHGKYLVGYVMFSHDMRWSDSPYDAWKTRNIEKARDIARKTGGVTVLFNPIVKQRRVI